MLEPEGRDTLAAVTAAQANADKADKDNERYAALYREGAVSAQMADTSAAASTTARAQLLDMLDHDEVAGVLATIPDRKFQVEGARRHSDKDFLVMPNDEFYDSFADEKNFTLERYVLYDGKRTVRECKEKRGGRA